MTLFATIVVMCMVYYAIGITLNKRLLNRIVKLSHPVSKTSSNVSTPASKKTISDSQFQEYLNNAANVSEGKHQKSYEVYTPCPNEIVMDFRTLFVQNSG